MGLIWQGGGSVPEIRPSQRQIEHISATRFDNSYDPVAFSGPSNQMVKISHRSNGGHDYLAVGAAAAAGGAAAAGAGAAAAEGAGAGGARAGPARAPPRCPPR